jgi:DNA polymerase-3 subunit beta
LKGIDMKIETTRDTLLNKILLVNRTITPKITTYVLSGIMLEADNNLNIHSTDLETSIKTFVKAKVLEKGKVIVPSKILVSVLKSFPEAKIKLEHLSATNELTITCQKAKFTLNTLSLEEYPQFPTIKKQNFFKIDLKDFRYLISKVQKASSTDESRIILTGVLIEVNKGNMKMVATDSYRLSIVEKEIKFKGTPLKVVIPARVLDSILKSDYLEGEIDINIEENQVSFELNREKELKTTIVTRLLSGKFPDYEKLIPSDFKHSIIVNREKIMEVIRRVSSIEQDNIPIKLDIGEGKISVSMNIREVGRSSEDFKVAYAEEKIPIAFNPGFLIDGIDIIGGKNIIFCIVEPLKPILIKPEKGDSLIYLLMPIRIS